MDISSGRPIEITDKPLFNNYFQKFQPEISEFTFTNLFIWRNYYKFKFMEWDNHLIIFSQNYLKERRISLFGNRNNSMFFPPIGPNPEEFVIEIFKSLQNVEFHRVPEKIIEEIQNNKLTESLGLEILDDRNNWDYVYEKEELLNLAGNRHRQNRRWLQKFLENYKYQFNIITEEWIEKTRELQLEWCEMRECQDDEDLSQEQEAINEALKYYSDLDFSGGILCVDNKCVAYTFGEKLNNDTIVIHIEKGHMNYEGVYQVIGNLYLKNYDTDSKYINREQDLGIPGLRRAKESYKPHHMIKKSIIYRKG